MKLILYMIINIYYGYDWYSFRDAAMESEHIVKKLFGDKEANVVIIYDNSKLIMSEIDRGISYQYLVALMQWWSNKLNLEIYLVFDNMTKIFNSKIISNWDEKENLLNILTNGNYSNNMKLKRKIKYLN